MALKAGYHGIKKSLLDKLLQMSGALIIKSLGSALSLSDAGKLSVLTDGVTITVEDGKLVASSAGGVGFIDEDNVITTDSSVTSLSYTATVDCYISFYIVPTTDTRVKVNDVEVALMSAPAQYPLGAPVVIPLKNGDVVTVSGLNGTYPSNYKVFGLK